MGVEYSKPRLSIHAAREGGDVGIIKLIGKFKLSIHAAREGGDDAISQKGNFDNCFQSTPPVKAATRLCGAKTARIFFQSTPPVKAATSARVRT